MKVTKMLKCSLVFGLMSTPEARGNRVFYLFYFNALQDFRPRIFINLYMLSSGQLKLM